MRLALKLCIHLAQQLVDGALDLHGNDGEAEHEVTKRGRLGRGGMKWKGVAALSRLVEEGGTTRWGSHRNAGCSRPQRLPPR